MTYVEKHCNYEHPMFSIVFHASKIKDCIHPLSPRLRCNGYLTAISHRQSKHVVVGIVAAAAAAVSAVVVAQISPDRVVLQSDVFQAF